jgi:hypothetical protein
MKRAAAVKAAEKTPECQHGMHQLCDGPGEIRREGAPSWEAPIMTVHCGCGCHRRQSRN